MRAPQQREKPVSWLASRQVAGQAVAASLSTARPPSDDAGKDNTEQHSKNRPTREGARHSARCRQPRRHPKGFLDDSRGTRPRHCPPPGEAPQKDAARCATPSPRGRVNHTTATHQPLSTECVAALAASTASGPRAATTSLGSRLHDGVSAANTTHATRAYT